MIIRTKLATEEQKKLILEGRLTFFTLQRKQDLITDIDIKVLCTLPPKNPNYKGTASWRLLDNVQIEAGTFS